MRVEQAIKYLSEHNNPKEEIILMYWSKDLFDIEFPDLSEDIWNKTVEDIEEEHYIGDISSDVFNTIFSKLNKGER